MVDKTWQAFGIFVLFIFMFAHLYNFYLSHWESLEVCSRLMIHPFRIILLLFGMAITINGYTLKSCWMVWCGIIGGIGGFIWESFYVTQTIVGWLYSYPDNVIIANGLIPCIMIALLAFIGLTLPGMKLKNK